MAVMSNVVLKKRGRSLELLRKSLQCYCLLVLQLYDYVKYTVKLRLERMEGAKLHT